MKTLTKDIKLLKEKLSKLDGDERFKQLQDIFKDIKRDMKKDGKKVNEDELIVYLSKTLGGYNDYLALKVWNDFKF